VPYDARRGTARVIAVCACPAGYGRTAFGFCWISQMQKGAEERLNVTMWVLFYIPMTVIYGFSAAVVAFASWRLRQGLRETLAMRQRVFRRQRTYVIGYGLYWTIASLMYGVTLKANDGTGLYFHRHSAPAAALSALFLGKTVVTLVVCANTVRICRRVVDGEVDGVFAPRYYPSLTHLRLPHSLTPSLPHSLTPSLPHSLPPTHCVLMSRIVCQISLVQSADMRAEFSSPLAAAKVMKQEDNPSLNEALQRELKRCGVCAWQWLRRARHCGLRGCRYIELALSLSVMESTSAPGRAVVAGEKPWVDVSTDLRSATWAWERRRSSARQSCKLASLA
jgi:hypothetical protein